MYYYEKDYATEIEDMIMDFLVYRKSKKVQKVPEYKVQDFEIGKGWPYYQDYPLSIEQLVEPAGLPAEKLAGAHQKPEEFPKPLNALPYPKNHSDEMFFQNHYSGVCKRLHVHVKEVIKEYEYDGSPIYDEYMNKEILSQILEKVLHLSQMALEEVKKIMQKTERDEWGGYHLLCSLLESLILNELYVCRRPKHRQLMKNDWEYAEYI